MTRVHYARGAGPRTNTAISPVESSWDDLIAELSAPVIGTKDGSYFIRAPGTRRSNAAVEKTAGLLILDGDSTVSTDADTGEITVTGGAPAAEETHAALTDMGVTHAIYPSFSNAAGYARYRVVIPCTYTSRQLKPLVAGLIQQLHQRGVMLAPVKENLAWSQPWYYPRCADQAALDSFKVLKHGDTPWTPADEAPAAPPAPADEAPAAPPAPAAPMVVKEVPGVVSTIDHANAQPGLIHELLAEAGYLLKWRANKTSDEAMELGGEQLLVEARYCSPTSESGVPGLVVLINGAGKRMAYSHHGSSDPLADGKTHDTFDLIARWRYGGDEKAALGWCPELDERNRHALAAQHYYGADEQVITVADAIAEIHGLLRAYRASSDVGHLVNSTMYSLLATVKHFDPTNWARIEADLTMQYGISRPLVSKLAKGANAVNKRRIDESNRRNSDAAVVRPGFLLTMNSRGEWVTRNDSAAADLCVPPLVGKVAIDLKQRVWFWFAGTHWEPCVANDPDVIIAPLTRVGTTLDGGDAIGYSHYWQTGVIRRLAVDTRLSTPDWSHRRLSFLNGVLDIDRMALMPTTPANAGNWVLPYSYSADADCPNVREWITQVCGGDAELVTFLRAILRAVLVGGLSDKQQVFLHLFGEGGTGKSTFAGLCVAMVGAKNIVTTSFRDMQQNSFELAVFRNKRLILISESDTYHGGVERFKQITGGDALRAEEKGKQRAGDFVYGGALIVTSNAHFYASDKSGALERRRRTINFNHKFSDDQLIEWNRRGGAEAVLHAEMPGLVNWLLAMTEEEMVANIRVAPAAVRMANAEQHEATNTIAAWLAECCVPEEGAMLKIGDRRPGFTGRGFDHVNEWAYPNYLTWCERNGHKHPSTLVVFSNAVLAALRFWNASSGERIRTKRGVHFHNIALKPPGIFDQFTNYFLLQKM